MTDYDYYCQGCFSNIHNYCVYTKYNADGKCPCCTCIVKVMCDRPCDKFKDFRLNKTVEYEKYKLRKIQIGL